MSAPAVDDAMLAAVALQLAAAFPGMPEAERPRFARSLLCGRAYAPAPESQPRDGVPRGTLRAGTCAPGAIYPGVPHDFQVYVPAQCASRGAAALMVFLDGARYLGPEAAVPVVLDNLIAAGELPPIVAVFVEPGATGPGLPVYGGSGNRSVEYDALGDACARFLLEELLPAALDGVAVPADPARRALCGLSSGGLCAFNAAFERPEAFGRVVSHCGSFVAIRGGDTLAERVRAEPARPLRVFLQTGALDLDIGFGDWVAANRALAAALDARGYEHRLVVGEGGHSLAHGGALFPDTLRWLWRDLPRD